MLALARQRCRKAYCILFETSQWAPKSSKPPMWSRYFPTRCSRVPNVLFSALLRICIRISRYKHTSHQENAPSFEHILLWSRMLDQLVPLGILQELILVPVESGQKNSVCFFRTCRLCHGACSGTTGCSAIEMGSNNVSHAASGVLISTSAATAYAPGPLKSSDSSHFPCLADF